MVKSSKKWQVTDMKLCVDREVQQSVVRLTAAACPTLSLTWSWHLWYSWGTRTWERVFLPGRLYDGLRALVKALKPLSSTTEKGCRSHTTILASCSSNVAWRCGVIGGDKNWVNLD